MGNDDQMCKDEQMGKDDQTDEDNQMTKDKLPFGVVEKIVEIYNTNYNEAGIAQVLNKWLRPPISAETVHEVLIDRKVVLVETRGGMKTFTYATPTNND